MQLLRCVCLGAWVPPFFPSRPIPFLPTHSHKLAPSNFSTATTTVTSNHYTSTHPSTCRYALIEARQLRRQPAIAL